MIKRLAKAQNLPVEERGNLEKPQLISDWANGARKMPAWVTRILFEEAAKLLRAATRNEVKVLRDLFPAAACGFLGRVNILTSELNWMLKVSEPSTYASKLLIETASNKQL